VRVRGVRVCGCKRFFNPDLKKNFKNYLIRKLFMLKMIL